jgi:integrase
VIRRSDVAEYFDSMRAKGASVETVNRTLRTMKAVLLFALERELLERNVMQRFRPFEGGKEERHVNRDAYSESEVQAILAAAKTQERALIGLLALAGLRPGEAYALDWSDVDLDGGCLRVARSWDHRGGQFVEPKTKAGNRTVPISGCLVEALSAHQMQSDKTGLVFANANGKPMNPSNVRRDIWVPLKKRAAVRNLDLYWLRHTFASLGRTAGESAFNVARMMGHAKGTLVDQVYAHTMQPGMASVASAITARAFREQPKLRLIEGGQRDVRETLENTKSEAKQKAVSGL